MQRRADFEGYVREGYPHGDYSHGRYGRWLVFGLLVLFWGLLSVIAWGMDSPPSWLWYRPSIMAQSVAFSPDGGLLAVMHSFGEIGLYRVSDGSLVRQLRGHTDEVSSVSFSPDGKLLASGSGDGTVKLWEVSSGQEIKTLQEHAGFVESVSFSPDGKLLASGNVDGTVKLWEVSSGQLLKTLQGHMLDVSSVSFSPDGKLLASGSWGEIKLWDVSSGQEIKTLEEHTGSVSSVSFSPDGKLLASGNWDDTVELWEVSSGQLLKTLRGHTEGVSSVSFSPDGKLLASGSGDDTVKLWDVSSGQEIKTLQGHTEPVWSVSFSPDGTLLASGGDGGIILWRIAEPPQDTTPPTSISGVVRDALTGRKLPGVEIKADGQMVSTSDRTGNYSFKTSRRALRIEVTVGGFLPFRKEIAIPQNRSELQFDIVLYPKTTAQKPKVLDVQSQYCDRTRRAYFLDGISTDVRFKAVIDWAGHTPGIIRFITPKGRYEGEAYEQRFDVGSEFGIGGQLKVVAVSEEGVESDPFTANFEVVPIPSGIPASLLSPTSGNVLKYGSSHGIGFPILEEEIKEGEIPKEIPFFGNKGVKFNLVAELGVEVTSEGHAKAWAEKETREINIAGISVTPHIQASLVWDYDPIKGIWVPGGEIGVEVGLDTQTPPDYKIIPVGPIPVPVYWRGGIEASLETLLRVVEWTSEELVPSLEGELSFEVLLKLILGVGISDLASVEGILKGGLGADLLPRPVTWSILLRGKVRVVLLFYKYERPLLEYSWELTKEKPEMVAGMHMAGLKGFPPYEMFKPIERDYLDRGYPAFMGDRVISPFRGDPVAERTMVSNEYPYPDPDIAIGEGRSVVVWLTDDPARTTNNRTKLVWSRRDGEIWSDPEAVYDDGTADLEPEVELLPNGDPLFTWMDSSRVLSDNEGLEETLKASEIEVAKYSSSGWERVRLTDNAHLDHTPHLRVGDDGRGMVVWISNPANDIIGSTTNPNQIWYSRSDGISWSQPVLAADRVGAILKSDLAYQGEKAVFIYSSDMDGDISTEDDRELYALTFSNDAWSGPIRLTEDEVKDDSPDLEYTGTGELMVMWYKGGRIVQSDGLDLSIFNSVVETGASSGASDFELAASGNHISLIWQDASREGVDLWTATYDPEFRLWSMPYQLTFDEKLERDIAVGYDGGRLILFYSKVEVQEEGVASFGKSDLSWMQRGLGRDLAVSDVKVVPENPIPGQECEISAIINSSGDLAADGVKLAFYDGNPNEGGKLIEVVTVGQITAASASDPIPVKWPVPQDAQGTREIYVVVDPEDEIEEIDETNNTSILEVMKPDLTVSEVYTRQYGDEITVVFQVENIGTVPSEGTKLALKGNGGEVLAETEIGTLGAGMVDERSISLGKVSGEVKLEVDPEDDVKELREDNNAVEMVVKLRLMGDVSGNGEVTAYDASLVLRYLVGKVELSSIQIEVGDVSGDGALSTYDGVLILQYVVGLIETFPVALPAPAMKEWNEDKLLAAIEELERVDLTPEQVEVLELLKRISGWMRPDRTEVLRNYPNPANPETWIPFRLAEDGYVEIRIYDVMGRLVRRLNLGWKEAGSYTSRSSAAHWDGRNEMGESVANGVYIYRMEVEEKAFTKRMVILK